MKWYLVIGLLISGVWAELDRLPFWLTFGLIIVLAFELNRQKAKAFDLAEQVKRANLKKLSHLLSASLLCVPFLISLIGKLRGEFPFSGDHDHHAAAMLEAVKFFKDQLFIMACAVVAYLISRGKKWSEWAPLGFLLFLWGASFYFKAPQYYFSRYPAGLYTLASPIEWLLELLAVQSSLHALEITNFLAIPLYLFVFRPIVLRRHVDLNVTLLFLLLFFNGQYLYYFTSSYLEPWSMILVTMAIELVYAENEYSHLGIYLIGFASLFKEQAILILPFYHLALFGRQWAAKKSILSSLMSALPFIAYYVMRTQDQIWRKPDFSAISEALASERLIEWSVRFMDQWGQFGSIIFVLSVFICLFLTLKSRRRWPGFMLIAGGFFQIGFFFFDKVSFEWTGYPRFHLLAYILILNAFLFLELNWKRKEIKWAAMGIAALGGFSTGLIEMGKAYELWGGLSYFEHYDSPQYYPLNQLFSKLKSNSGGTKSVNVFVNTPSPQFHAQSMALAYKNWVREVRISAKNYSAPMVCVCNQETDGIILLNLVSSNLRKVKPWSEEDLRRQRVCFESLVQHCSKVEVEESRDGSVVGYLASGVKGP